MPQSVSSSSDAASADLSPSEGRVLVGVVGGTSDDKSVLEINVLLFTVLEQRRFPGSSTRDAGGHQVWSNLCGRCPCWSGGWDLTGPTMRYRLCF